MRSIARSTTAGYAGHGTAVSLKWPPGTPLMQTPRRHTRGVQS